MKNLLLLSLLKLILSSGVIDNIQTSNAFTMNIDGNEVTKYVSCADWSPNAATTSGDSITISGGGRCYITNTPELAAETFYKFYPVDKKLCFDVNNSKVHCNCNSALYILKMPARKEDGSIDTDNPYCDCDAVGGNYCPDFDISEANKYALQVTPHPCSPPNANGHYTECDKQGCPTNLGEKDPQSIGPGSNFIIDTTETYTQCVTFSQDTFEIELLQGTKTYKFQDCGKPGYIEKLTGQMTDGMVFTMSLWGTKEGGMSWLDGSSGCKGSCEDLTNVSTTYSNIRIN